MKNSRVALEAIHKGRTRLLSSNPFYGYLCCRFKLREDEHIPTCATDGIHLFYNPEFMAGLTKSQVLTALAHETEHVYLKHMFRFPENGNHMAWQFATDYAINSHLKDGGFDLIAGALFPEQPHWKDSAEEHYKRLMKNLPQMPKCGGHGDGEGSGQDQSGQGGQSSSGQQRCSGHGSCSGVRKLPKGTTAADKAQIEAELQTAIMNAASFAKAAGKLPADIERMISDLRAPKVSWTDVLRRFMISPAKNDYRMMPPNRRYIHQGLYLPSMRSEQVSDILLIIDGSGSTHEVFPQFMGEFISVLMDVRPERLNVMVWDTRCSWNKEFTGYDDETEQSLLALQPDMGAGGGSQFQDCFDWFEREVGLTPQVAIVLTDMEIGFPDDPGYPVMWIATEDIEGPFGETIRIDS